MSLRGFSEQMPRTAARCRSQVLRHNPEAGDPSCQQHPQPSGLACRTGSSVAAWREAGRCALLRQRGLTRRRAAGRSLLPPQWDGAENGQKVELEGRDKHPLIRQQRKGIIVAVITEYANQAIHSTIFSHRPMTDLQSVPEQWLQNSWISRNA